MSQGSGPRFVAFALPAAVVLTVACGLAYVLVQQDLRNGANDPQIQLAEDAAAALDGRRGSRQSVIPTETVDLATSLAPWLASTTELAETHRQQRRPRRLAPDASAGVLAYAKEHGRDVVTWQPRAGTRIALVAIPWSGGTVLAGPLAPAGRGTRGSGARPGRRRAVVGLIAVGVAAGIAAWMWPASRPAA